jgi:GGDEF domain-containing protein
VSIGIAQQPQHGSELKDLLQAADRAMYAAKARGGGVEVAR